MREAYRNSTIKGPVGIKTVAYWWNASINDKKKECMEARRRYTRIAKLNTREDEKLKANEKYSAPFVGAASEDVKVGFPEVTTLMEEKLEEGKIEYVTTHTETVLSSGKRGKNTRTLYMMPYEMDQNGVNDVRKLYEIMTKLEQKMATHESEEIKLVAMGNIDIEYVRKCTECIFRKTNKICGIVMPRDKMSKAQGAKPQLEKGDVMVEVQGGKDKAEALKQEIIKNNADTQVEIKNSKSTVYVTGIDGDINSDEVSQGIKNSGGGKAQWGDMLIIKHGQWNYARKEQFE
ncbi:hypothetical protein QE152_g15955 [Popillia japonica]|uniref:Uncharacterized protein n=1 Tax=Popillia japonica TaxID=7064 RepID=A0AAW1L6Q7_POPJA